MITPKEVKDKVYQDYFDQYLKDYENYIDKSLDSKLSKEKLAETGKIEVEIEKLNPEHYENNFTKHIIKKYGKYWSVEFTKNSYSIKVLVFREEE